MPAFASFFATPSASSLALMKTSTWGQACALSKAMSAGTLLLLLTR